LIPAYVTRTVNEAYSIPHRRALLLGWATRFTAFCAELPELARAAGSAGSRNIFTAGASVLLCGGGLGRGKSQQGVGMRIQDL
jgi:hypothetical protein